MGSEESALDLLRGLNVAVSNYREASRLLSEAERGFTRAIEAGLGQGRATVWEQLHRTQRFLDRQPVYFSQAGQDRILDLYFHGKKEGVFVDVGSFDGITGSNTLFFEIYRNWSGLCIEPSRTQHDLAAGFRRGRCLNMAVGAETGSAEFLEITAGYTQMSGLSASYHSKILEFVRSNPEHQEHIHSVPVSTLQDVLDSQNICHVDVVSLDIEGGELAVLENFPFDRIEVTAWTIENTQHGGNLQRLMEAKSYQLFEVAGVDEIYVRPSPL